MKTGYIYKICCTDISVKEIYVGSTKSMRNRRSSHKSACLNESDNHHNLYLYKFIRAHGGWDNWTMVVIDTMTFTNKEELHTRERKWIEDLQATLNCNIPMHSISEWYQENKEEVRKKSQEYYAQNTDHIKQRVKNYALAHKDEKKIYSRNYSQENQDHIREYQRQYRESHENEISSQRSEQVLCECGSSVSKRNMSTHRKSDKHRNLLTSSQTNPQPDIVAPIPNDDEQPGAEALQQVS